MDEWKWIRKVKEGDNKVTVNLAETFFPRLDL